MLFDLLTIKCPVCSKEMMKKDKSGLFTSYIRENQESQMEKKKVVFISSSIKDNEYICVECEKAGMASFKCSLCGIDQSSDQVRESFGSPAEYLCKKCYETVSAKDWAEKVDELEKAHRWDYE